jgi:hypothetical protein
VLASSRRRVAPDCSTIREPIDILDLAWVTHVAAMRALRELVSQIWHGDVGAIFREQSFRLILTRPMAFAAPDADHVELACGLAWRVRTLGISKPVVFAQGAFHLRSRRLDVGFLPALCCLQQKLGGIVPVWPRLALRS